MSANPFFMRFVERQDNQEATLRTGVKAGAEGDDKKKPKKNYEKGWECMKYPSDDDEPVIEW